MYRCTCTWTSALNTEHASITHVGSAYNITGSGGPSLCQSRHCTTVTVITNYCRPAQYIQQSISFEALLYESKLRVLTNNKHAKWTLHSHITGHDNTVLLCIWGMRSSDVIKVRCTKLSCTEDKPCWLCRRQTLSFSYNHQNVRQSTSTMYWTLRTRDWYIKVEET